VYLPCLFENATDRESVAFLFVQLPMTYLSVKAAR